MFRYFTSYVTNETFNTKISKYVGVGLVHAWTMDPKFEKLNLTPGDFIYWLTNIQGALFVISALQIGKILSYADFVKQYGKDLADGFGGHGEAYHVASRATTMELNREISPKDAKLIRFEGKNDRLKFDPPGSDFLDRQTLRAPRKLTPESATLLDRYLGGYVNVTGNEITAWRKVLRSL